MRGGDTWPWRSARAHQEDADDPRADGQQGEADDEYADEGPPDQLECFVIEDHSAFLISSGGLVAAGIGRRIQGQRQDIARALFMTLGFPVVLAGMQAAGAEARRDYALRASRRSIDVVLALSYNPYAHELYLRRPFGSQADPA